VAASHEAQFAVNLIGQLLQGSVISGAPRFQQPGDFRVQKKLCHLWPDSGCASACTVDGKQYEAVLSGGIMKSSKLIASVALVLNLGVASYAQQRPVKMTFSGTAGPGAIILQAGTTSTEDNFAGSGSLGQFTFRDLVADTATPQASSTCSGPNQLYFVRVGGAAVFRFQDGSLLIVNLTQGDDCIDLAAQQAHCTAVLKITGGTGRFKNATGIITMTETVGPVLADAAQNPVFFAATGEFTGTVSGVGTAEQ
jgi:hypothetical protein